MSSETPSSTPSPSSPPSNASTNACNAAGTHVSRAFMCQITQAMPNEKEAKAITEKVNVDAAATQNSALQSYLVWRRSTLIVSIPFIFIGMILGIIDWIDALSDDANQEVFNGFGKLLITIQSIDSVFLFAGVLAGLVWWNQFTRSIQAVRLGFLISFIMPLIPALFPLEMIVKMDIYDAVTDADIVGIKIILSMGYVLQLLPIIISFPGGAIRGALRIRWLLPESMLSGWILVMSAPFYSILLCVALVVVMQVAGNFLLFIGTLLVVAAPWVYVVKGNYFVRLWTDDTRKYALITQRVAGIASLIGYAIVLVFAFTGDVSGVRFIGAATDENDTSVYLISYAVGFRIVIETFGRLFITTLMFCDALLRMNVNSWFDHESGKSANVGEVHDRFQSFASAFTSNSNQISASQEEAIKKVAVVESEASQPMHTKTKKGTDIDDDAC